ncbi:hypothetical protein [Bacteroides acidifaciens]|uniref:hypothetical protein n=1 Tax=Bacteroides acidifaciens TaxID=85831 RepID=UPI0026F24C4F|nr:hypothetical protein [Bacteroides acidifaciens]
MANSRVEWVKMCNSNITEARNNKNAIETAPHSKIESAYSVFDEYRTVYCDKLSTDIKGIDKVLQETFGPFGLTLAKYDVSTGTALDKLISSANDILDRLKTVADADSYKQICIDAFDAEIEFFESIEYMYVPA